MLDINYTLAVLPGNDSYYHLASIVALFTDVCKLFDNLLNIGKSFKNG